MTNSELFKLCCQLLIIDENPELKKEIKAKFISGEVDLLKLIHLSSNHLVLPVIYFRLKEIGLINLLPSDLANHVNEIYNLNTKRNKEILLQIDEINNKLNEEGIEPIYLKGTANLLSNLYLNISDRMIGDIDFLVCEKDFLKTVECIKSIGYKQNKKIYDDLKTLKHYPRLFKENVPADIEVHQMPVNIEYSKMFNNNIIIKEKIKIDGKENCFVLSDKYKLIQTFIHSQLINSGYHYRVIALRDLYDIFLLSKRVDLKVVLEEVEEQRKAIAFFEYSSRLLNNTIDLTSINKRNKNKFAVQHEWFLNHGKIHRFYIFTLKNYGLFSKRILKVFINKSALKYLLVRLKDPGWWYLKFHIEKN